MEWSGYRFSSFLIVNHLVSPTKKQNDSFGRILSTVMSEHKSGTNPVITMI
jgi:hypothetical protein